MISIDDVCMLANVIIINSIRVDLVLRTVFSHGVATIVVAQAKDNIYHD